MFGQNYILLTEDLSCIIFIVKLQDETTDNSEDTCNESSESNEEPKLVEQNIQTLIQELIDLKIEPEEFCVRLEKLSNEPPQPCMIAYLRQSLPLLRQSLNARELVSEGIQPPPAIQVK